MIEIIPNLYIGVTAELPPLLLPPTEWDVVNVASTFHKIMHNWKKADKTHKCYVYHEEPHLVSINWVDAEIPAYFNYDNRGVERVNKILAFIKYSLSNGRKVCISCDQGVSRSPMIALLYLVKYGVIQKGNFLEALSVFQSYYPAAHPGKGISEFVISNWTDLVSNHE